MTTATKIRRYVYLPLWPETLTGQAEGFESRTPETEAACARAQTWLEKHAGENRSITVRDAKPTELQGRYEVLANGPGRRVRILDEHEDDPELGAEYGAVQKLIDGAYCHACDTWPKPKRPERRVPRRL